MKAYTKFGFMTKEYTDYQQPTWDQFVELARLVTAKAIKDGVCPVSIRETMKTAIDCGNMIANVHANGEELRKSRDKGDFDEKVARAARVWSSPSSWTV